MCKETVHLCDAYAQITVVGSELSRYLPEC